MVYVTSNVTSAYQSTPFNGVRAWGGVPPYPRYRPLTFLAPLSCISSVPWFCTVSTILGLKLRIEKIMLRIKQRWRSNNAKKVPRIVSDNTSRDGTGDWDLVSSWRLTLKCLFAAGCFRARGLLYCLFSYFCALFIKELRPTLNTRPALQPGISV